MEISIISGLEKRGLGIYSIKVLCGKFVPFSVRELELVCADILSTSLIVFLRECLIIQGRCLQSDKIIFFPRYFKVIPNRPLKAILHNIFCELHAAGLKFVPIRSHTSIFLLTPGV